MFRIILTYKNEVSLKVQTDLYHEISINGLNGFHEIPRRQNIISHSNNKIIITHIRQVLGQFIYIIINNKETSQIISTN